MVGIELYTIVHRLNADLRKILVIGPQVPAIRHQLLFIGCEVIPAESSRAQDASTMAVGFLLQLAPLVRTCW